MDLSTEYLNMRLKNPLVAGPSPLTRNLDNVRALEDAGVSAIVINSLFEEEISQGYEAHEHFEQLGAESYAEAVRYVPAVDYTPRGPDDYLDYVTKVKAAVDIPVMASLNGTTLGGWIDFAAMLQQAGADALELNIYHLATDPAVDAAGVEDLYVEVVDAVVRAVAIPVALKIGPYFTSLAHFAKRVDETGVGGLVLFNRFYQPDVDLEALDVVPDLSLSAPHEVRLPLRWIAILDPIVRASLAASTAVYTWAEVLKLLMVGADATQLCATLLRHGTQAVGDILTGMQAWLEEHEYSSVDQLKGSMNYRTTSDPSAFERANYMRALRSYA